MSSADCSALPTARCLHWILLAWPGSDQNRVGRKYTSRTDRGEPSAGRSYGVEESSLLIRNMRNNKRHQALSLGRGSAKSVPICCAKSPIEASEEDSLDRRENRVIE